jgi:hypothetical protein
MKRIERGGSVRVGDFWYEIVGFALAYNPDGTVTGSVFTLTPTGSRYFEPCLGYRINYDDIEEIREPTP